MSSEEIVATSGKEPGHANSTGSTACGSNPMRLECFVYRTPPVSRLDSGDVFGLVVNRRVHETEIKCHSIIDVV
jgi:hypothetical protein